MFIEPMKCSHCHKTGRPGELGFGVRGDGESYVIHCECGNQIPVPNARDQLLLSQNELCRLGAIANYNERGTIQIIPGACESVTFRRPIDFICKAYLVPDTLVHLKEDWIQKESMVILSSTLRDKPPDKQLVTINWQIYGLVDIDALPSWYVLFCGAVTNGVKLLSKPALLDYAASFEAFLADFLKVFLTQLYGESLALFLLRRNWRVEDRCKDLLYLATGFKMSDRSDVYLPWDQDVRKPMDKVRHGEHLSVDKDDAERAHQAVYQAIRWIESLPIKRGN